MNNSAEIPRVRRAPQFVSKRTARALLDLSESGFGKWVKTGILPPPVAGSPLHEPRWRWSEIVEWMTGGRPRDLLGDTPPIGNKRGPQPGHGGRPRGSDTPAMGDER